MALPSDLFLGIDVGTHSVRAGLFDLSGGLSATAACPIALFHDGPDLAEYASADIWAACGRAVADALAKGRIAPERVKGIGFDATCSLVVVGGRGAPVSVSPAGTDGRDTICWMDHRAIAEADEINATGHAVLERVGFAISPEMQMPKILWLKRHRPAAFAAAAAFFDLPDWLVHKATGEDTRSLCSVVCKWTYFGERGLAGEGWDPTFFARVGLDGLLDGGAESIGRRFAEPGAMVGRLTEAAAASLGLNPGIAVAAGSIDAHAGAVGTLGAGADKGGGLLAIIAGTSICHIAMTDSPVGVPGVWGPYHGVVEPGRWTLEGGQSAGGALIDRLIDAHPAAAEVRAAAIARGETIFAALEGRLAVLGGGTAPAELAADIHVQPDFLGNRSPLADPSRRGAVVGLTMDAGADDLARLYLAGLQSLAYGTRHILWAMQDAGIKLDALVASGGLARNRLFLRELADSTGLDVLVPDGTEPVLLGGAMLAATAAGAQPSLGAAMRSMAGPVTRLAPDAAARAFHDRKYRVFRRMQDDFAAYRAIMAGDETR